jgi:hypothetical protein
MSLYVLDTDTFQVFRHRQPEVADYFVTLTH